MVDFIYDERFGAYGDLRHEGQRREVQALQSGESLRPTHHGAQPPAAKCWKCGGFGHRALACPSPQELCRQCGRTGHRAAECSTGATSSVQREGKGKDKGNGKGKAFKGKSKTASKGKGKVMQLEQEAMTPCPVEEESNVWLFLVDIKVDPGQTVIDTAAAVHVFPLAEVRAHFEGVVLQQDGRVRLVAAGGQSIRNFGQINLRCFI